jgi:PTH1 family peptidyl-tRNA hydrolase
MWLIVGLGNPGSKYAGNRHNVGFRVIDELARRYRTDSFRDKFGSHISSTLLDYDKVLLQKPMEYMNHSGYAVQRAASFYDVAVEDIVVIHDDIDLDLGRTKLKGGGGHGGHNGLRSMIEQLGSRDFIRVRCGIGRPGPGPGQDDADAKPLTRADGRVTSYVLGDFARDQADVATRLFERAADAIESIVRRGLKASMNQFNNREGVDK